MLFRSRLTPTTGLVRDSDAPGSANEDFLFHLYRGSELLQDNRVHEAKEELEQALHLQPRDAKGQDLLAVVYFVLGYLAFGAIFAAIGALAPGTREAQQYSGFLGFFAVVPLVVSGLLLGETGSALTWILALIPLTAPATMLQVLALAPEIPWPMVGASLLALVAWVLVATIASGRVFRATLLLYGVRPSRSGRAHV